MDRERAVVIACCAKLEEDFKKPPADRLRRLESTGSGSGIPCCVI